LSTAALKGRFQQSLLLIPQLNNKTLIAALQPDVEMQSETNFSSNPQIIVNPRQGF